MSRWLVAALVAALAYAALRRAPLSLWFELDARPARADAAAQVFWSWSSAADFAEAASYSVALRPGIHRYRVPVPAGASRLRFDPADEKGALALTGLGASLAGVPFFAWSPAGGLRGWHANDELRVEPQGRSARLVSSGDDPSLVCDTMPALSRARSALESTLAALAGALALALLGAASARAAAGAAAALCAGLALFAGRAPWDRPTAAAERGGAYDLTLVDDDGRPLSPKQGGLAGVLDPYTLYRNAPNQRTALFEIDAGGRRRSTDAHPGLPAAVVQGGSAAFGFGLDSDSQTLSSALNRLGLGFDWRNAGVVGFASGQELGELVHYSSRLSPSLYVSLTGWNDAYYSRLPHAPREYGDNWMIRRSLEDRLRERAPAQPASTGELPAAGFDESLSAASAEFEANLERMDSFARARGGRLLVVLQPYVGDKRRRTPEEERAAARLVARLGPNGPRLGEFYARFVARAMAFCAGKRLRCLDATRAPELAGAAGPLFLDDVHLNARGTEVLAGLVAKAARP